ncbi:MFS transporter [Streptosporangium sandarakinum]
MELTKGVPIPLHRNRNFQLLWLGSASAMVGSEVADVAYPLIILGGTGSPGWAGLFGATQLVSALLCGLPAGELLDRTSSRRILVLAESIRLIATATVAIAAATGRLSAIHLLLVAVVLGAAQPFASGARMVGVRLAVEESQLTRALTQEEVRSATAGLVGPPLGGYLYGLARAFPFAVTAVLFLLSWLSALLLRLPGSAEQCSDPRPASTRRRHRLFEGVTTVWRDRTLRGTVMLVTALNTVGAPLTLITVVLLRQQNAAPWAIGTSMAALAAGGLAGATLVASLHRLFRPGTLLLGLGAYEAAVLTVLPLGSGPVWVAAVLFCAMLGVPALRVLVDVLVFRQVRPETRGRVIAGVMTLFTLGAPAGVAVSGLLLQHLSARTGLFALAGVMTFTVLVALADRELRHARWPTP